MRAPLCLVFALLAAPAHAWDVRRATDPLTDRTTTFATVSSGPARLYVGCLNGQVWPEVEAPNLPPYRVGVSYRFDSAPVVQRIVITSQARNSVSIWTADPSAAVRSLRASRRLRVQIGVEFYDFDTSGGEAALGAIKCR